MDEADEGAGKKAHKQKFQPVASDRNDRRGHRDERNDRRDHRDDRDDRRDHRDDRRDHKNRDDRDADRDMDNKDSGMRRTANMKTKNTANNKPQHLTRDDDDDNDDDNDNHYDNKGARGGKNVQVRWYC